MTFENKDKKYVFIKKGAKVYMDGKIVEWSMPDKLMRITSALRRRTRMTLSANFTTCSDGDFSSERRKVLAWLTDLKFAV